MEGEHRSEPDEVGDGQSPSMVPRSKRSLKDKKEISRLETKNLNRFFRSKINEMLRDIKDNPESSYDRLKAEELLNRLNESNKIMFS